MTASLQALLDLGPDDRSSWRDEALCAQVDTELFFPEKGGTTRHAKAICAGCDVRAQCLEFALTSGERFGIWGGLSERERRRLMPAAPVVRERRPVDIDHGTEAGWKAHRRLGEEPCGACREAASSARQRREAERPAPVRPEPPAAPAAARERPGITRPWRHEELAEAVRVLADYGMTPAEIAAELHAPARRVRALYPAVRGVA